MNMKIVIIIIIVLHWFADLEGFFCNSGSNHQPLRQYSGCVLVQYIAGACAAQVENQPLDLRFHWTASTERQP